MFQGFSKKTGEFLWELAFNNERPWFLAHKDEFEEYVNAPFKALAEECFALMEQRYPALDCRVHVSRIYRDARRLFGRGPYKDHLWFSIKASQVLLEGPMFWFEVGAADYSYGMGFWAPKAALMEAYRKGIDENPETLAKLVRRFNRQTHFVLAGPEYARSKGEVSELLRPWYQKKSVNLQHELPPDERIFSPELAQDMIEGFEELMPFYKYFDRLWAAQTEK